MKYIVLQVGDDDPWADPDTWAAQLVSAVGVFKAPTVFCDPSDGHRGKKTQSGFTRGKKWGWWVCATCKKPTEQWGTDLNAILGSATNLLPNRKV